MEDFLPNDPATKFPVCIGGQMTCPPDDCGGIHSFYDSLKILKNKKHPEYRETSEWFGRKYDPIQFNKEKINKQLSKLDNYINKWLTGE